MGMGLLDILDEVVLISALSVNLRRLIHETLMAIHEYRGTEGQ
jgi:hypothetical protein